MELIDKDKLDDYKFRSTSERMDLSVEYMSGWNDAIDRIEANAPRVYAKPVVHGHWDYLDGLYCDSLCSECGTLYTNYENVDFKFCPHCGAQMDGEEE